MSKSQSSASPAFVPAYDPTTPFAQAFAAGKIVKGTRVQVLNRQGKIEFAGTIAGFGVPFDSYISIAPDNTPNVKMGYDYRDNRLQLERPS